MAKHIRVTFEIPEDKHRILVRAGAAADGDLNANQMARVWVLQRIKTAETHQHKIPLSEHEDGNPPQTSLVTTGVNGSHMVDA